MSYESCIHRDECTEGGRYGKGCYEDDMNNVMGGKPWLECMCGVDNKGNPPMKMNERIKTLLNECTDPSMDKPWPLINTEKFAELIIQECATFVDSQTSDNGYGVADSWCEGKDLLKHFGVE